MKKIIIFWILFGLFFSLISLILLFYLDLANGPFACFIMMIVLLFGFIVLRIRFRNKGLPIRLSLLFGFIFLVLFDLVLAKPGYENRSAVLNSNPLATEVLELNDGKIQGVYNEDATVEVYAGIPYAKAPVGDLRWKEPQDVESWNGIRDCSYFRDKSMQPKDNSVQSTLVDIYSQKAWRPDYNEYKNEYASEDSLYVNVWKPNTDETNLPVLVYIHGGSLTTGSASFYSYNGEAMAKKGIIQVNIAYRLGIFGYLALDELANESSNNTTGNYGLLDQIKALNWVNDNIEVFGGDKNNITICGESAGSSSVSALCASPLSKGLFQKAIGESSSVVVKTPPHTFRTLDKAKEVGNAILKEFNCDSVDDLRNIPASELVKSNYKNDAMTVDGYALPKTPYEIYEDGEASDVPLLNGFNSMEADAFTIPSYLFKGQPNMKNSRDYLLTVFEDEEIVDKLMATQSWNTNKEAFRSFNDIMSAFWFTNPHYSWDKMIEEKYTSSVYTYYFDKDNGYYGGYHSGELTYVFDTLDRDKSKMFAYDDSDYELADTMNSAWATFIKTGNPSSSSLTWNEWNSTDCNVMHFGSSVEMITDKFSSIYSILEEYYLK